MKLVDHIKMYLDSINTYFVQINKLKILYIVDIY